MKKVTRQVKRVSIALIGGIVLVLGIVAIPYPGPGWLIVFAGLGILATEFEWAQNILDRLKSKYDAWQNWLAGQPIFVKAIFWTLTCLIVILTVWLLNGYGLIANLLRLDLPWVHSPLTFL